MGVNAVVAGKETAKGRRRCSCPRPRGLQREEAEARESQERLLTHCRRTCVGIPMECQLKRLRGREDHEDGCNVAAYVQQCGRLGFDFKCSGFIF